MRCSEGHDAPEHTAQVTGIEPSALRELVAAYRDADGAALYSSTGVNMGGQGTLAFWLQEVINAVSGNLDRVGGTLVGKGPVDFPPFAVKFGLLGEGPRSRLGDRQAVNDALPGGLLAQYYGLAAPFIGTGIASLAAMAIAPSPATPRISDIAVRSAVSRSVIMTIFLGSTP